ncbi:MAG: nucleotidyltransferase substrate binding protein [Puniceicoccales bacterium]|jgi:hypothetical protein|nr:nucleotidyltransferase substrate binding protein [Puniceicoccales bacterium]
MLPGTVFTVERLDFGKLADALAALDSHLLALGDEAVAKKEHVRRAVLGGVVHAFAIAYEVARCHIQKRLGKIFGKERTCMISKRELFSLAEEIRLISDAERWIDFHAFRNASSHNYTGEALEKCVEIASKFLVEGRILLERLAND